MKPHSSNVFAVRFIGFTPAQIEIIDYQFRSRDGTGKNRYVRLPKENLQDPDLFLVDAVQVRDASALRSMGVSPARPALIVGTGKDKALPAAVFHGRLDSTGLLLELDSLVAQRARVLSSLPAAALVSVPERRRRERHGATSAAQGFTRLRRQPLEGGILVVDESSELSEHVATLMAPYEVAVTRVASEELACAHCRTQRTALVILNTGTGGIDHYRLCAAIKAIMAARVKVVFLLGGPFIYDQVAARRAGCDGFLETPLAHDSVAALLKRFIPALRPAQDP